MTNKHLFFVLFILFCAPAYVISSDLSAAFTPYKAKTPPVIDGKLNDPVWQNAPYVTNFKTFVPDFGMDMVEKTKAFVAYDRENLYFAFRCFDSQPDKIKTSVTSRDNVRPDDWVCINLDSFNDQQSLYAFYINPMGIQGDSRYASGNEDFSVDLVWYSKGRIDKEGYTVEVRIPFKSIRFEHKNPVEMGVIFERRISRRSEQGTFPPLDPEKGMAFLTQMMPIRFYDIKHYTLFELLPAITYSRKNSTKEGKLVSEGDENDVSLTTKYGITSHLILDGTYNPDFSQVEADAGQVDANLRYDLFYPEKRPFFLEGKENFNFGGPTQHVPLRKVVHTRNIVNPIAGVKLTGKLGSKNTIASIYAMDELPESTHQNDRSNDYAHFSIFRYKRALKQDSYVGGFYTRRERTHRSNSVFGIDGEIRVNQSSMMGYHLFGSNNQSNDTDYNDNGHALGVDYTYDTRNIMFDITVFDISKHFHTETGYLTRKGVSSASIFIGPKFYPEVSFIRRMDLHVVTDQTKDKFSNQWETFNFSELNFVLWRNSSISVRYNYSTEIFLAEKFNTSGIRFSGRSQFTKQLYLSFNYSYGNAIRYSSDPYQGKSNDVSASITYQPFNKFISEASFTYSDFYRESDSRKIFDYAIIRSKNTYQLNRYLFFRAIIEYNSFRKQLLTDFLASFTYIPGTVIHLGYGSLYEKIKWRHNEYIDSNQFLETKRGFFFKTSYLWRL